MEVSYELTKEDFIKFQRNNIFKVQIWFRLALIIFSALLLSPAFKSSDTPLTLKYFCISFGIWLIVFGTWYILVPFIRGRVRIKKWVKKGDLPTGTLIAAIDDKGIMILGGDRALYRTVKWNIIRYGKIMKDYIFISIYTRQNTIIPLSSFSSPSAASEFVKTINENVAKEKKAYKEANKPPRPGKFYFWGLLGFVPIAGFAMGIIIIVKGAGKYRNWKLITMGIADIFISIFAMVFLVSQIHFDSHAFDDANKSAVLMNLNDAVKSIEFYKLNHGVYPDSLQELPNDEGWPGLYDLFSGNTKSGERYLQYSRIGSKYTIFSVGFDNKPNTPDDIYPNLYIADTSRIGLIRK